MRCVCQEATLSIAKRHLQLAWDLVRQKERLPWI